MAHRRLRRLKKPPPPITGRPALVDRERILRAALEIGIDELSMSSVARKLEVSTTALYRYYASKEDLLDACMNDFCRRISLPDADQPWQDYMAGLARSFRAALLALPGASAYGMKVGPTTPAAFAILDEALGVLMRAGFGAADAWRVYAMVVDYCFSFAAKWERFEELEAEHGPGGYAVLQLSEEALEPFPNLAATLAATGVTDFSTAESEALFDRNIGVLLAGLTADYGPGGSGDSP
ncbi:MAG: TetR/AcrR family transcriptional regulator C-terminal domain-containing protein [Pseudomonadota bacterium]